MTNNIIHGKDSISTGFLVPEHIPSGKDEYYLRDEQAGPLSRRPLRLDEIIRLEHNRNRAETWETVLVSAEFDPDCVRDSSFYGLVRIGALCAGTLEADGVRMPTGITGSRIVNCDIGDDAAIHDVRLVSHCIIGDNALLFDIGEMHTTASAKFGGGHQKDGETGAQRTRLVLMNEAGGREALPFDGMIPADACLFANFRDEADFQKKLIEITDRDGERRWGLYSTVGSGCVIRHTRVLVDVKIGPSCSVLGADRLSNVTINSSAQEPTSIGEGVTIENGIVGRGCAIAHGARAGNFILSDHCHLDYGARLVHTVLGENSTVAGGEVQHDLIFAAHEQHHSSSFLIAAVVMGQSNGAAGTVIGSNHNSRSADGEIKANRGFWPGLCVSLKHSSRFASFTLLSKGDFPAELDIPLPFSLVGNDASRDRLEVMPAFYWLHNMYALIRNSWKFGFRDRRVHKTQNIEFDFLAPDTVEEIFKARRIIERVVAFAWMCDKGEAVEGIADEVMGVRGRAILEDPEAGAGALEVLAENMEKSRRGAVITGAAQGYHAYGDMLHYYAVRTLVDYLMENKDLTIATLASGFTSNRQTEWTNLGGQIVHAPDLDELRREIVAGTIDSWSSIHDRYDALWQSYRLEKPRHAWATLCAILGTESPAKEQLAQALQKGEALQQFVCDEVFRTRKKDDDNPFRQATFRNAAEMQAVVTKAEENEFVLQIWEETRDFKKSVEEVGKRG